MMSREITMLTSMDHLGAELDKVIALAANSKIDLSKSITHRMELEQVNEGVRVLKESIGNPTRVVLLPHGPKGT
jgi:threonine dehydrogenase-like Zn-dependent dehydrogenase